MGKICDFWTISRCISITVRDRASLISSSIHWLSIATEFNDLGWPWTLKYEFYRLFGNFGLWDAIQERIAPKPIEIDINKLRMKFLALNVDFDGSSFDFLVSRKPAHESIKSGRPTLVKVVFFPLLASLLWKRFQIGMGMLSITTSTKWLELFSGINIDDFERSWTSKIRGFYWFLRSSAAAHNPRMNCDEMARDRLTVCEQELLLRVSWALAQISCYNCFR